jgi:anti-sigma factor RsiW
MSKQPITEAELHAWIDGELSEERRAAVESHVAANPLDAARLESYRRNDRALAAQFDAVLHEAVPARLTERPRRRRSRLLAYVAAVGWLALGGIAGWQLHGLKAAEQRADFPSWARRAVVAHVVFSPEVRHPVEVAADQEAHLVAWLSKRLGTALKIPRLDGLGFGLVGGRLLPGDQGPAAQFMYQDGQGQRLTLYVRTNRDATRETAFRFAQDGNVRQFYWIDRGLGYALSGEISKEDLLRVATAVYQHLNP